MGDAYVIVPYSFPLFFFLTGICRGCESTHRAEMKKMTALTPSHTSTMSSSSTTMSEVRNFCDHAHESGYQMFYHYIII